MNPGIVADLHPPRLPALFTAPGWDDFLAAAGLGLMLAALLVVLAMPALRRRRRLRPARLSRRLAAAAALPPAERLLALARLLAEQGKTLPPDQRLALYRGEPGDPAVIETLIRARPEPGRPEPGLTQRGAP